MKTYTYSQFRSAGMNPPEALRAAKISAQFSEFEALGLVRLTAHPEEESYFDAFGAPDAYTDEHGRRVSAERAAEEAAELIERKGCWYTLAEWRADESSEWGLGDSCGMHTGYDNVLDPRENWYVPDLMAETLRQLINHREQVQAEATERAHWEARDTVTI